MFHFDEQAVLSEQQKGFSIVPQVEKAVDEICKHGYRNLFYIGIGGTYFYANQLMHIEKQAGAKLPIYLENAADFCDIGNPHFGSDSIVAVESVSGDTKEMVEAVEKAHKAGAKVIGYVEKADSPIARMADYRISSISGGYYFWYTVTLRFMKNAGFFPQYDDFYKQFAAMPENVVAIYRASDAKAENFAKKYCDSPLTYLVGSGNLEDWAMCYGTCIMEEMLWMHTRPVPASNFFHGTLEVIDRDANVILIKGEDATRPQMERVEKFVSAVCANVTVFDTRDYPLKGIREEYRWLLSPMIMRSAFQRVSTYLEYYRRHPLAIRRYYRRLDY